MTVIPDVVIARISLLLSSLAPDNFDWERPSGQPSFSMSMSMSMIDAGTGLE
jgi:hypothetical protein